MSIYRDSIVSPISVRTICIHVCENITQKEGCILQVFDKEKHQVTLKNVLETRLSCLTKGYKSYKQLGHSPLGKSHSHEYLYACKEQAL